MDEYSRRCERISELFTRHELPDCAPGKRAPHETLREPLVAGRGEKRLSGYGHSLNMSDREKTLYRGGGEVLLASRGIATPPSTPLLQPGARKSRAPREGCVRAVSPSQPSTQRAKPRCFPAG